VSVVRATGRQALGGLIIFISYYVFALPTGVPLMFLTDLGLAGIILSIHYYVYIQYGSPKQEVTHKLNFTVERVSVRNSKS